MSTLKCLIIKEYFKGGQNNGNTWQHLNIRNLTWCSPQCVFSKDCWTLFIFHFEDYQVLLAAKEVEVCYLFCSQVCSLKQLNHTFVWWLKLCNPGAFIILQSEDSMNNSARCDWHCKATSCSLAVKYPNRLLIKLNHSRDGCRNHV